MEGVGGRRVGFARADGLDAYGFAGHVDSVFRFHPPQPDAAPVSLVLSAVELIGDGADGQWFALTLLSADGAPLAADSYDVTHDDLGDLSMFVTPIGLLDDDRVVYEAIFDRREVAWSSPVATS